MEVPLILKSHSLPQSAGGLCRAHNMLQNIRSADSESTSAFLITDTLIFLRSQNRRAFSRPVRRAALTSLFKNDQGTSAVQSSLYC